MLATSSRLKTVCGDGADEEMFVTQSGAGWRDDGAGPQPHWDAQGREQNAFPGAASPQMRQPYPQPPAQSQRPSPAPRASLMGLSWAHLRRKRALLVLPATPVLVGVTLYLITAVAIGTANAGEVSRGLTTTEANIVYYAIPAVVLAVGAFCHVALAAAAHQLLSGHTPTVRSALAVAWRRRRAAFLWALALFAVKSRFRRYIPGRLFAFPLALAWEGASYFAAPSIALYDAGPIAALRHSVEVMRRRWPDAVRLSTHNVLHVGAIAAASGVLLIGSRMMTRIFPILGLLVFYLTLLAFFVALAVYTGVVAYARVVLYRYAVGLPTPGFYTHEIESFVVRSNNPLYASTPASPAPQQRPYYPAPAAPPPPQSPFPPGSARSHHGP